MNYKKLNNLTGWLVFAIATAVYLLTMEQTTSLWDCGEYITTANKLEVGHPPGAPLWMMLGRLFSAFASPENVAMMINSMSALSSSFTILFLFWSITMMARKLALKDGEIGNNSTLAILGAGAVGALAYTFTDSFWFSAVEGEVYAMSSFFTAIVFWAILKWDLEVNEYNALTEDQPRVGHPNRWIVFISYMIGLSIGVHLLNLLAIPAIGFVIYFKKYKFKWSSFFIAGILSLVVLVGIQNIIIPKIVSLADSFERFFVNGVGMPFNSGALFFLLVLLGLIIFGLRWSQKNEKELLNTAIVSFAVLLIGYSSFAMIVIRSNANPPLDENNPESLSQLHSYLQREQYGSWPIGFGQYWNSPAYSDCKEEHLGPDKSSYMKVHILTSKVQELKQAVEVKKSDLVKIERQLKTLNLHLKQFKSRVKKAGSVKVGLLEKEFSFMNEWELNKFKASCDSINSKLESEGIAAILRFEKEIKKEYINALLGKRGDKKFISKYCTVFPRMYRQGEGDKYKAWCGYEGDVNNPLPANQQINTMLGRSFDDRKQQYDALIQYANIENAPKEQRDYLREVAGSLSNEGLFVPSFTENISYMLQYQMGWMYWRYFLWNFAGRQNDTQGYGVTGSQILEGNWLSGVNFIDNQRLGDQSTISDDLKLNKGYNRYYMIPLILGLIGFFFQLIRHPKSWFTVFLLFVMTGIAIVIYLNQKPAEPRERDYAYAASFYAFSYWIGLGVFALFYAAKSMKMDQLKKVASYVLGGAFVVLILQMLTGQSLALGYSLIYMGIITTVLFGLMFFIGRQFRNAKITVILPIVIGLCVPTILAIENWDDHDRSNRSTARDFAYNYLNSCDYNAILFTNGDNDTFPLWYIQEVEGIRTDVRVANMSLLSTDWHINQMKKKAYESDPLPIKMRENVYRNGSRDYVLINETEENKYKNNKLKVNWQNKFQSLKSAIQKSASNVNVLQLSLEKLFKMKDIADALDADRTNYKAKSLSSSTIQLMKSNEVSAANVEKASSLIKSLIDNPSSQSQVVRLINDVEKTFEKWPLVWHSAQEAVDFISDDRNKEFQNFSCNQESYINFKNIYIEVDSSQVANNNMVSSEYKKDILPVIKWRLKGNMLYKADLAVLSLLANYNWERPIYFASIQGMQANQNLKSYMQCEGLTYKLTPVNYGGNGGTNTEKMVALLTSGYQLKKPNNQLDTISFLWGNMKEPGVLVDYYTMRMVQNLRLQMMKLSNELIAKSEKAKAIEILDKTFEVMPVENEQVPAGDISHYLCMNYFQAEAIDKGMNLAKTLTTLELSKLNHYLSFNDNSFNLVWKEFGQCLVKLENLRQASTSSESNISSLFNYQLNKYANFNGSKEEKLKLLNEAHSFLVENSNNINNPEYFIPLGILDESSFEELIPDVKQKFYQNINKRFNFFFSRSKFPIEFSLLWSTPNIRKNLVETGWMEEWGY